MKKSLLSLAACAMIAGSADAMYIVGDPAGAWSPANGIEMKEADGGWKWTGAVGADKWFAFATQLEESGDWGVFNSTYRLNPASNGTVSAIGEYTLELGGADRAFKGSGEAATFFIKEVGGVYTLTVSEAEEEVPEPEKLTWSVVGEFNGWGEQPDFQMTEVRSGVWKATMYDLVGEFKFRANNDWNANFGYPDDVCALEADGDYALVQDGKNFILEEPAEEIIFYLDVNRSVLTVEGLSEKQLALLGSMNGWSFSDQYVFEDWDGTYTLYLDEVKAGCEFKVSNFDWSEEYTTEVLDMEPGVDYPLLPGAGRGNMGIAADYNEVTFMFSLEDGYFCFFGQPVEEEDGVAATGIAAGKPRFFNLQGVEVQNPASGLYIRVIDGRSEKVTVK